MNRRSLLGAGMAGVALPLACRSAEAAAEQDGAHGGGHDGRPFQLRYAPHPGMFGHLAGDDVLDQIKFMADHGFTAMEYNRIGLLAADEQERIGAELERHDMQMGVFVVNPPPFGRGPTFAAGKQEDRDKFLADIRGSVEVAQRVQAKWCTVVPGDLEPRLAMGFQTANVIDSLRAAVEICEPAGLTMVLEPLNHYTDHATVYLTKIPQAYAICRAVNSPACKILFDIYHQQITEGNLINNIDATWDETAYFQIGDNPGRKEPGTGEINYRNIFKHIHAKGYDGVLGMEHGKSIAGAPGERALIAAYRAVDDF